MVFESGRSASVVCEYDHAVQCLDSIAEDANIKAPVSASNVEGLETTPFYRFFVRGAAVTHALIVPMGFPQEATVAELGSMIVPTGFHDGVNNTPLTSA